MSSINYPKSIILIDDDESSNFLNKIFIKQVDSEINVHALANGKEGLDFILNRGVFQENEPFQAPALVMLDIRMPIMDGWQFLQAYEKEVPQTVRENLVIVLITISEDQDDIERANNEPNIVEYIRKPLSDIKFKKLIKKYFNKEFA